MVIKKKSDGSRIRAIGIALIIMGVIFFAVLFNDITSLVKPVLTLNGSDIPDAITEDRRVEIDVDAVLEWYEEETATRNGVKTGETYYGLVWLDDNSFIGMKVNESEVDTIDSIIDDFWDYYDGLTYDLPSPIHYSGITKKMSSEDKGYFNSLLNEIGIDESNATIHYLYIDTTLSVSETRLGAIIAIALLVIGLILIVISIIIAKKNKDDNQGNTSGPKYSPYGPYNPNQSFTNSAGGQQYTTGQQYSAGQPYTPNQPYVPNQPYAPNQQSVSNQAYGSNQQYMPEEQHKTNQ